MTNNRYINNKYPAYEGHLFTPIKKIRMADLSKEKINEFIIYNFIDRRPEFMSRPNYYVFYGTIDLGDTSIKSILAEDELGV